MSDLLTLNAASYFGIELTSQILSLKRPIGGLVIAKGASHHLEVEGLAVGGMTFSGIEEKIAWVDTSASLSQMLAPNPMT